MILGNTYHLMLRPGEALVEKLGGLHRFMSWERPILTDSGGFQVFSPPRGTVTEEGVTFRSHLDGSSHALSPERAVDIQQKLGTDVLMAFDECPPADAERAYLEESLARTTRWALRCKEAWKQTDGSALFGIVQGGLHPDLRRRAAEEICALDLPGYALGGFSVGEEKVRTREGVAQSAPLLPTDRPRYLMGVGTPEDLLDGIAAGIDMFDCVLHTAVRAQRLALHLARPLAHPQPGVRRGPATDRRHLSLRDVQDLQPRLPASPLRLEGAAQLSVELAAQRDLLPLADGRCAQRAIAAGTFDRYAAQAREGWRELPEENE